MAWVIDAAHSHVGFTIKHMMISTVRGQFHKFTATINLDEANLQNSTVEGVIETASIDTNEPNRDGHLRSADFFDAEKYPNITFKSTKVEAAGDGELKIHGNLTIKDTTKAIVLTATDEGKMTSPAQMGGVEKRGFTVEGKINRKDFGLNWNVALEAGGWLVGEDVKFHIELELNHVVETAPAATA